VDKEKAKRNLKAIIEKMQSDTDANKMHEYYKLYKKEVSLLKRSWTAAWLFMYYDMRETPVIENIENNEKIPKTKEIKSKETKTKNTFDKPAIEINMSDEESKRLFISIGKNRRLFPREVITLIMSKTTAAREDIGMIRILDNYSFVQVRDAKADEIIEKLTGVRFRGRTLTVNYAKPKSSDEQ